MKLNDFFSGIVANSPKVVRSLKYKVTYYTNVQILHIHFNIFTSFALNLDEVTLRIKNEGYKYILLK